VLNSSATATKFRKESIGYVMPDLIAESVKLLNHLKETKAPEDLILHQRKVLLILQENGGGIPTTEAVLPTFLKSNKEKSV
jgi:hypothetical protein